MSNTSRLFLKEWRAALPAFAAIVMAVNWKLAMIPLMALTSGGFDPMLFYVAGLEPDGMFLTYMIPTIVVFWAGLRTFAPEWRQRTMVWLKTFPVGDGTVAGVKLATGVTLILLALLLGFAIRSTCWMALGGAAGWSGDQLMQYFSFSLRGVLWGTLLLAPGFLLGALVSSLGRRIWLALGVGIGVCLGFFTLLSGLVVALVETGVVSMEQGSDLLRFPGAYPAASIPLFLVIVGALTVLTVRAHCRREIAG